MWDSIEQYTFTKYQNPDWIDFCQNLRAENSVRFQIIEQHTWDTSTLKSNIYRLMKIAQRRKASVEVRKLSFVYSHNSHLVWEWSNVNYKANFVAWKNYMLIAFRDENYQAYFIFILRSKRSISIGIERGKNLESLKPCG